MIVLAGGATITLVGRMAAIANILRTRLDEDGHVIIDENLGDVSETYQSLLFWATNGEEGDWWGMGPDIRKVDV